MSKVSFEGSVVGVGEVDIPDAWLPLFGLENFRVFQGNAEPRLVEEVKLDLESSGQNTPRLIVKLRSE